MNPAQTTVQHRNAGPYQIGIPINDAPRTYSALGGYLATHQHLAGAVAEMVAMERENAELVAALERIENLSDLAMSDGDGARQIAREAIAKATQAP